MLIQRQVMARIFSVGKASGAARCARQSLRDACKCPPALNICVRNDTTVAYSRRMSAHRTVKASCNDSVESSSAYGIDKDEKDKTVWK